MALEQFKNAAKSTLASGIDGSQTTITVADGSVFPSSGQFRLIIENEILLCTARSSNTLTVTRGVEGTSGASHSSGLNVTHIITAGALDQRTADECMADTLANRPAAGRTGALYLPTDGPVIQRDNGSSWTPYGPMFRFKAHAVSDYAWVNQSTASAVDRAGAVSLVDPNHNSENFRLLVKSAPSPAFKITVAMRPMIDSNGTAARLFFGVLGRESSSGKFVGIGFLFGGAEKTIKPSYFKYSSPTLYNASSSSYNWGGPRDVLWARYEDDGANRILSVSADGFTWGTLLSEARTTFCTADQVGIGLNNNQSTTPFFDSSVLFLSYEES